MEKKPPKPMTPFDEMIVPPHLQMLKLFLPYTPVSNQKFLGIFVKFMEFQQTIHFFQAFDNSIHTQNLGQPSQVSPAELFQDLKPYLPPQAAEMADSFMSMMSMMDMMQTFQEQAADQGTPPTSERGGADGTSDGNSMNGFRPMDMMMGMLTPEQQSMFEMYNTMFSGEPDNTNMEGDGNNERMDESPGNEESGPGQTGTDSDGRLTDIH